MHHGPIILIEIPFGTNDLPCLLLKLKLSEAAPPTELEVLDLDAVVGDVLELFIQVDIIGQDTLQVDHQVRRQLQR